MDSLETLNKKMQQKIDDWHHILDKIKQDVENNPELREENNQLEKLKNLQNKVYAYLKDFNETSGDMWQELAVETQKKWINFESKLNNLLDDLQE